MVNVRGREQINMQSTARGALWVPTLYFAQGLPYVAVMTIAVIMYKRLGISNTDIALYTGWLYLPWVIKPLWSPVVDLLRTKRWWVLVMQAVLAVSFAAIAFLLPGPAFFTTTLAAFWLTAFASATHDIASDGFYMLALNEHGQSVYVGIRTMCYRLAMVAGQGGLVVIAGLMEQQTGNIPQAWAWMFAVLSAIFVLLAFWHLFVLPHPSDDVSRHERLDLKNFINTFVTFFTKPGVIPAVAFILLYRLPEAQLVKLINPFLLDTPAVGGLGLSTTTVGLVYGTVGVIALIVGGIVGGLCAATGGLKRWMMPMAWSMSLTCLTFVWLSYSTAPSLLEVYACVGIEQFGYGFGTSAYMLYLMYYSEGPLRTSHYAIATGIMALGMMLPGMAAGWLQEVLGYRLFFWWTMICCIATVGVASLLKINPEYGKKR